MNGSMLLEVERFDKLSQLKRLLAYVDAMRIIQDLANVKVQSDNSIKPRSFWDIESDWEKRLYNKMKSCEARHPILGIVICTILGGILISLIAGIILEAFILVM